MSAHEHLRDGGKGKQSNSCNAAEQSTVIAAVDDDSPDEALRDLASGPRAIWCPQLGTGRLVLPRYRDVRAVLRSSIFGCFGMVDEVLLSLPSEYRPLLEPITSWTLYSDPPDHGRVRGILAKAFTPSRIEMLRPTITTMVDDLLDRAGSDGSCDIVQSVSIPLPVLTIAALLGAPTADWTLLRGWSDDLIRIIEPDHTGEETRHIISSWQALWNYFGDLMTERRAAPRDDALSALLQVRHEGYDLSVEEIISNCISLLLGGHETTTNLLSLLVLTMDEHPELRPSMAAVGRVTAGFVDEVMRLKGPAKMTARIATEDTEVAGVQVLAGQRIVLLFSSANRDPDAFAMPDVLDPAREPNPHLGFGFGIHACFGASLARLQGQVLVRSMAERFPRFGVDVDEVRWKPSRVLRAAARVPVALRS